MCWVSSQKETLKQAQVMLGAFGCLEEVHSGTTVPPQLRYSLAAQKALPHAVIQGKENFFVALCHQC